MKNKSNANPPRKPAGEVYKSPHLRAIRAEARESNRDFLQEWRIRFRAARKGLKREEEAAEGIWEGVEAYAELKKLSLHNGLLSASTEPTSEFGWLFRSLLREVQLYSSWTSPADSKSDQHLLRNGLAGIGVRIQKLEAKGKTDLARNILSAVARDVGDYQELLKTNALFEENLRYTEEERQERIRMDGDGLFLPLASSEAIQVEFLESRLHIPPLFTKNNLETRFQLLVAGLFWIYLKGVSVATLGRLVALTYVCGNFLKVGPSTERGVKQQKYFVGRTGRQLELSAIQKVLRKAGVQRLDRKKWDDELVEYIVSSKADSS
jgi:hypothetical protein